MAFACGGVVIGGYLLWRIFLYPPTAFVLNKSIHYHVATPHYEILWALYVLVIVGSGIASSRKTVQAFGAVLFGSLVFALYEYKENAISVWCFFSALLSAIIYWHFTRSTKKSSFLKKLW